MIVYPNHNWMVVLTTLKGSILIRIAPRVLMITLLAVVIVFVEKSYPDLFNNVSATPLTLLGLSLSIFMSFRNSSCYERWWEGRKMWGLIVIETRAIGRETVSIEGHPLREEIMMLICGFAHAMNVVLFQYSVASVPMKIASGIKKLKYCSKLELAAAKLN